METMWFFVSDLHGDHARYQTLFETIRAEAPAAVLLGGDLLPHEMLDSGDFVEEVLAAGVRQLADDLGGYPSGYEDPDNVHPREIEDGVQW